MKVYYDKHKGLARQLRNNPTDAEKKLWGYLRAKQIEGLQFYRQRMISKYIVDFYCPQIRLVIEVDGGQHYIEENQRADKEREAYLRKNGIEIKRYSNIEVLKNIEGVCEDIYDFVRSRKSP